MVQTEFNGVAEELEEISRQIEAARNAHASGSKQSALTHIDNVATIMEENDRASSAQGVRRFEEDYANDELDDVDPSDVFAAWDAQIEILLEMAEMADALGIDMGAA